MTKFTFTRKVLYCCSSSLPGSPISGADCCGWSDSSVLSALGFAGACAGGFAGGGGGTGLLGETLCPPLPASWLAVPGVIADSGTPLSGVDCGAGAFGMDCCCCADGCWQVNKIARNTAGNHEFNR